MSTVIESIEIEVKGVDDGRIARVCSKHDGAGDGAYGLALGIWLDSMYPRRLPRKICYVFFGCQKDRCITKLVKLVQVVECQRRQLFADFGEVDLGNGVE